MNQSLQELCELQIFNENAVKKASFMEFDAMIKMAALFYTSKSQHADPDRIRGCKEILKRKTGLFSNFRGTLMYAIQVKMSLAPDPEAYLDEILSIYGKLAEGRMLPGEILVMTAITIYELRKDQDIDSVVAKTKEAYSRIKSVHRFLTDENDMSFIALMVMSGKDVEQTTDEVEKLYTTLKDRYRIPSDSAQSVALVLSMSNKPLDQKVDDYISFYEKLKAAKHHSSRGKSMSIYAAYADLDISRDILAGEIGDVDEWLKGQKGYGMFSAGTDVRRVMAATLVLQYHAGGNAVAASTEASEVVSQVIAEDVILTVLLIIIVSVNASIAASRS